MNPGRNQYKLALIPLILLIICTVVITCGPHGLVVNKDTVLLFGCAFVSVIIAIVLFYFFEIRKEAYRRSEEKYKMLFESNPIAMWVVSLEDKSFLNVNNAAIAGYGYSREEFLSMKISDIKRPDDLALLDVLLNLATEVKGYNYAGLWQHRTKNGGTIEAEVSWYIIEYEGTPAILASAIDVTSQRRTEESYKANETRYKRLIETMTDGLINTDTEGRINYVNSRFCEMTGYSRDELVGKIGYRVLLDSSTHDFIEEKIRQRNEGHSEIYEIEVCRKNGSKMWVRVNGSPVYDEEGNVIGHLGIHTDIEDLKQALEALKASEVKFRSLVEYSLVGVYLLQDYRLIYNNPKLADMFGYSRKELIGKSILDLLEEEEREEFRRNIENCYHGIVSNMNSTLRGRHKSGKLVEVELHGNRIIYNNKPTIIGTLHDITSRREMERALLKSEQQFRSLIEFAPIGVISLNGEGMFLFANQAFLAMTGYSEAELKGLSFLDLIHTEDIPKSKEEFRKIVFEDAGVHYLEKRFLKKNGENIWGKLTVTSLRDESGVFIYSIGMVEDITGKRETDEKLRRTSNELNTFFYQTSHDLKGPVSSIIGLITLAQSDADTSRTAQYLQMINTSARRLDSILITLLEAIRIREGFLRHEPVNISEIVEEIILSLKHSRDFSSITIRKNIQFSGNFLSDHKMIGSLFQNLVENAIKYQDKTISDAFLDIQVIDQPLGIRIRISDNGIGIDPSLHENVFTIFFKGSAKSKGTGLGLYIVKNIVDRLGGTISLSSTLTKGTSFDIFIPRLNIDGSKDRLG